METYALLFIIGGSLTVPFVLVLLAEYLYHLFVNRSNEKLKLLHDNGCNLCKHPTHVGNTCRVVLTSFVTGEKCSGCMGFSSVDTYFTSCNTGCHFPGKCSGERIKKIPYKVLEQVEEIEEIEEEELDYESDEEITYSTSYTPKFVANYSHPSGGYWVQDANLIRSTSRHHNPVYKIETHQHKKLVDKWVTKYTETKVACICDSCKCSNCVKINNRCKCIIEVKESTKFVVSIVLLPILLFIYTLLFFIGMMIYGWFIVGSLISILVGSIALSMFYKLFN
jgi:hypothetical protein